MGLSLSSYVTGGVTVTYAARGHSRYARTSTKLRRRHTAGRGHEREL